MIELVLLVFLDHKFFNSLNSNMNWSVVTAAMTALVLIPQININTINY